MQRFRVACLFTGQSDTGENGTIAGAILGLFQIPLEANRQEQLTIAK